MAIVINGSGTVTGISVGGLPDGIVDAGTLATNSVDSAELIDGAVDNSHLADDAVDSDEIAAGAIDVAHLASGVGGKVLQVIQGTWYASGFTTTATGRTASGYTISITPTSSSNKILVWTTGQTYNATSGNWSAVEIRNNTDGVISNSHTTMGRDAQIEEHFTIFHLFDASSTSAHTFELYQGASDAGTKVYNKAQLFAMEIAG